MRVVVAPDKFKGSLTAVEAAEAIAEGLPQGRPDVDVVLAPVADGGDGTVSPGTAPDIDTPVSRLFRDGVQLAVGVMGEG